MVEMIRYPSEEAELRLAHIAGRRMGADPALEKQVLEILEEVRSGEMRRFLNSPGASTLPD